MKRRSFVAGLSAAAAWPLVAYAQKPRRIGVLMGISENPYPKSLLAAFQARLRELGWTEGSNLQTDYRWAAVDRAKSRAFARELVALQPDVIVAHQNSSVEDLLRETRTIPIVFVTVADPIGNGFVGSYPHPGRQRYRFRRL
jgi:putative ABC transport system substrate-binding protein